MKAGDKVWVLCEVFKDPEMGGVHVLHKGHGFWAAINDCKRVDTAEVKQFETSTLKVGDLVELRGRNRFNGARGLLTQRHPDNGWFWFEASDPRNRHISGWREETWEDEECGTFRLVKVD